MEQAKGFEAISSDLEKIVKQLEGGELSLEDSLKLFEQGIKLPSEIKVKPYYKITFNDKVYYEEYSKVNKSSEVMTPLRITDAKELINITDYENIHRKLPDHVIEKTIKSDLDGAYRRTYYDKNKMAKREVYIKYTS